MSDGNGGELHTLDQSALTIMEQTSDIDEAADTNSALIQSGEAPAASNLKRSNPSPMAEDSLRVKKKVRNASPSPPAGPTEKAGFGDTVSMDNATEGSGTVASSPKLTMDLFSLDTMFSSQLDEFLSTGVVPDAILEADDKSYFANSTGLQPFNANLVSTSVPCGPPRTALDHTASSHSAAQATAPVFGYAEEITANRAAPHINAEAGPSRSNTTTVPSQNDVALGSQTDINLRPYIAADAGIDMPDIYKIAADFQVNPDIPDTHPSLANIKTLLVSRPRSTSAYVNSLIDIADVESTPFGSDRLWSSSTPSFSSSSTALSSILGTPPHLTPSFTQSLPRTVIGEDGNVYAFDERGFFAGLMLEAVDLGCLYFQGHIAGVTPFPEVFEKIPVRFKGERDVLIYCFKLAFIRLGLTTLENLVFLKTYIYGMALVALKCLEPLRECFKNASRLAVLDVLHFHPQTGENITPEATAEHINSMKFQAEFLLNDNKFVLTDGNPYDRYINALYEQTMFYALYSKGSLLGRRLRELFGDTLPPPTMALGSAALCNTLLEYKKSGGSINIGFKPRRFFKEFKRHLIAIKLVNSNKIHGPIYRRAINSWAAAGNNLVSAPSNLPPRDKDYYGGELIEVKLDLIDDTMITEEGAPYQHALSTTDNT